MPIKTKSGNKVFKPRTNHAVIKTCGAVCDPVMGDEGRLYAAPEMVPLFRDALLPAASVLTPNCFEAELLTGLPISDDASAAAACDALHARGPHTVVRPHARALGRMGLGGS